MNPTHQPATQPFDRLRELDKAATEAPWFVVQRDHRLRIHGPYKSADGVVPSGTGLHKIEAWEAKSGAGRGCSPTWRGFTEKELADFALIAESRNALPALLNSHAALVADKERLEWIIQTLLSGGTPLLIERLGEHCIVSRTSIDEARAALATAEEKPRKNK